MPPHPFCNTLRGASSPSPLSWMPPPPCLHSGIRRLFVFFSSCLFSFAADHFSSLSRYMRPVLSLANARARRYALLLLPHTRRALVRFFIFLYFSFHSLTATPSCPPLRHASPPRYASRCAVITCRPCRRAFVTRRPCCVSPSPRVAPSPRIALSSPIAPVASCRAFATRCAFVPPRLATLRHSCGGNGGEREWAGGQGGM